MLSVRVKNQLKEEATKVFDEIGISLPEAVRVFLHRVVRDGGLPFRLEVPNAETAAAIKRSREGVTRKFATAEDLFDALEKGVR